MAVFRQELEHQEIKLFRSQFQTKARPLSPQRRGWRTQSRNSVPNQARLLPRAIDLSDYVNPL
jgi:hypothetical protein